MKNDLLSQEIWPLAEDYLANCQVLRGQLPKTIRNKRNAYKRLVSFLDQRPLNLETMRAYATYMQKQGWNAVSVKTELKNIRAFVTYLAKEEKIGKDFLIRLEMPKIHREELAIVPADVAEKVISAGTEPSVYDNGLAKKSKVECRLALRFALRTGLRSAELRSLRTDDMNFEDKSYWVSSKGSSKNYLPLPEDMILEIKEKCQTPGRVFNVKEAALLECMKRGCRKLEIGQKMGVHTLRHVFCTELARAKVPITICARLMRHSHIEITNKYYTHFCLNDLRDALMFHPLIKTGLSTDQVLDLVNERIQSTGIDKDRRFQFSSDRIHFENGGYVDTFDLECWFTTHYEKTFSQRYMFCRGWDEEDQQWDFAPLNSHF